MSDTSSKLSQADIDRLVDGSLTGDAYRKMIQRIESSPDGWRQCAMTFLEQQALANDFGELIQQSDDWMSKPTAAADELASNHAPTMDAEHSFWNRSWKSLLFATAASFLIAFSLGIAANQWMFDRSDLIGDGGNGDISHAVTPVSDTVPVVVEENLSGQQRQYNLPVMNVANGKGDLDLAMRNQLPSSLDQMIRKMDVPYEVRRNMVSLTDKDGNIYYVPVDQIKFGKSLADYQ